ncbi:MAG: hypothetical protein ABUT20_48275 [Bacteroidota bacterium]
MKKTLTGIIMMFLLTTGYAQVSGENSPGTSTTDYASTEVSGKTTPPYSVNIKAVRNFYEKYGDNTNESWYATGYGFRAKFNQDGISYMADYDKKGGWLSTVKTYTENKLPKYIREKVRREYYDHRIFLVKEIDQRRDAVYYINIENNSSWMTLRVTGDDMEAVSVFEK